MTGNLVRLGGYPHPWLLETAYAQPGLYVQVQQLLDSLLNGESIDHLGQFLGFYQDQQLESAYWWGGSIIPIRASSASNAALAQVLGRKGRHPCSVVGNAPEVLDLYRQLGWSSPRGVRPSQPLLEMTAPPQCTGLYQVERASLQDTDELFSASVAMFIEEVGFSPIENGASAYRKRVHELLERGRTFVVKLNSRIVFKADLGLVSSQSVQLQGVWVHPEYRGRGLGAEAIAAMVTSLQSEGVKRVGLYVNNYNRAALKTYARVGFVQIGEYATVMY